MAQLDKCEYGLTKKEEKEDFKNSPDRHRTEMHSKHKSQHIPRHRAFKQYSTFTYFKWVGLAVAQNIGEENSSR